MADAVSPAVPVNVQSLQVMEPPVVKTGAPSPKSLASPPSDRVKELSVTVMLVTSMPAMSAPNTGPLSANSVRVSDAMTSAPTP